MECHRITRAPSARVLVLSGINAQPLASAISVLRSIETFFTHDPLGVAPTAAAAVLRIWFAQSTTRATTPSAHHISPREAHRCL